MHPPGSCPTEKARGTPANEKRSLDGHRSVTDTQRAGSDVRAAVVGVPFYLEMLILGVNNMLLGGVHITR